MLDIIKEGFFFILASLPKNLKLLPMISQNIPPPNLVCTGFKDKKYCKTLVQNIQMGKVDTA